MLGNLRVDREFCQHRNVVLPGNFINMAFTKYRNLLAAVRALQVAHVLYQTDDRNVHLLCHLHGLCHDHGNQLLRRGHDDDAIHRKGLEYG